MIEELAFPMGKTISCHHGVFTLPSEIYGVGIDEDSIDFHCEDGDYTAERKSDWMIRKM